ncbi:hypothetical protein DTO166G4_9276 [Paecilomyces variotii]|nr:hypothetical protein DTO166G4_9276 [Paecilomyces variotii]
MPSRHARGEHDCHVTSRVRPGTGAESSTVRRRPPGGLTFNGTGPPPGKTTPAVTPPGVGSLPALPPAPPPQRSRPRRPLQVAAPVAETPTGFLRRTRQPAEVHGPKAYSYPTTTCGAKSPRSGTDSDLEAFSHNPADGSVAALPGQTAAKTNYLNQRFLSY